MSIDTCKIYNGRKLVAEIPCSFAKRNNAEYLEIRNQTKIKPGNHLVINNKEKFYITDIRIQHPSGKYADVYFETIAQHKERIEPKILARASIVIAILALVVSIVALFTNKI